MSYDAWVGILHLKSNNYQHEPDLPFVPFSGNIPPNDLQGKVTEFSC
jgi:hypothetical protein